MFNEKEFYCQNIPPLRKKNFIQKSILKYADRAAYERYKFQQKADHFLRGVTFNLTEENTIHFKHSGNAGDIIYAIPCMYALARLKSIHLHLNPGVKNGSKDPHPLGNVMLNEQMVEKLKPLLLFQEKFEACTIYKGEPIDVDLDQFRLLPIHLDKGHISRWFFYVFGVSSNLCKPWLKVDPFEEMKDYILISRSQRYRTPGIDYSFLKKFPRLAFAGVEEEFKEMKGYLPHLEYRKVNDFLELAGVIAGSKFFIGNQSFPFSLAEGLKCKRILEVSYKYPNVLVSGPNSFDFLFQPQFEKIVEQVYNES